MQLQEHLDDITNSGGQALGISVAAAHQAEHLMETQVGFELLVDPGRNFKTAALGIKKLRFHTYLYPTTLWRYLRWGARTRQGRITAGLGEPPGVAIIDSDMVVRYIYEGQSLGDYPPIESVLLELHSLTG